MQIRPCMLMILDGWGIASESAGNAVKCANTPFLNQIEKEYPHTQLECSGESVGLPPKVMGNSEVGHMNIGAGRIVYQDLLRISRAVQDKTFFQNPVLNAIMSKVKTAGSTLHLMGLVSDGSVHSHINHIFALIDMAQQHGLDHVNIHAILDGRDTAPNSGIDFIRQLDEYIKSYDSCRIATICGRYYAMDRDKRWERVEKAYRLYIHEEGISEKSPVTAVKNAYERGETDEFIKPIIIAENSACIRDGDGIIFFNFRADRAREITRAFTDPKFDFFPIKKLTNLAGYVCMTVYDQTFDLPAAFPPVRPDNVLGKIISKAGLSQLRIAETEKYAHVTYFFNGGEEKPFPLEDRCLIPSPKEVPTYDLKPEMSATKVTEEVISRLKSKNYDLIVLNFANMDMVGHTGVFDAAVKACEVIDKCIEKIVPIVKAKNGVLIITSDHGNAEKMIDENGGIHTAHTTNPVPFILVDDSQKHVKLRPGILGDIAPTILHIMGIEKPAEMTGKILISGQ